VRDGSREVWLGGCVRMHGLSRREFRHTAVWPDSGARRRGGTRLHATSVWACPFRGLGIDDWPVLYGDGVEICFRPRAATIKRTDELKEAGAHAPTNPAVAVGCGRRRATVWLGDADEGSGRFA